MTERKEQRGEKSNLAEMAWGKRPTEEVVLVPANTPYVDIQVQEQPSSLQFYFLSSADEQFKRIKQQLTQLTPEQCPASGGLKS